MFYLLATDAHGLTSVLKPLLVAVVLLAWAVWAPIVDKDAEYFHLKRQMWNAVNIGTAAFAFLLLFLIPWFIVGFALTLLAVGGVGATYFVIRNKAVPAKFKWNFDMATVQKLLSERRQKKAEKAATLKFKSSKEAPKELKPVPLAEDDLYETHLKVEEVFEAVFTRHAQSFEIAGADAGFTTTLSVDGSDYKIAKHTSAEALAAIDYLKMHCGLDVTDRRRQQTGQCGVETLNHGTHQIKVKTSGSTRGIQCAVFIDPVKQVSIPFTELGLLENQLAALKPVIESHHGVVVIATPPQQGRTTTLYALTTQHDPYTMDIHLVEPELEREWEAITHHLTDPADQTKKLRSIFLRDPHVVTVPTVSDQPTAQQIAQAAAEGKRVYAGLRAEDAMSGLKLWMKAVGDKELVAKSLSAVISQRLVRKLCPFCRQKYKPDAAALKKLNLPADKIKELYKAGGKVVVKNEPEPCPACQGIGYQGRTAAFEVIVIDDEGRKLIAKGELDALRTHVRRQRTLWLEEAALSKVVAGVTSIGEAMRSMGHEDAGRPAPPAAEAPVPAALRPPSKPKPASQKTTKAEP